MSDSRRDFFISYTKVDLAWAEWITRELEEAGYTTWLQIRDFEPGSNFALWMQRATKTADRTVAVLSPDYLSAPYVQPEWAAAFAKDPTGEKGTLLPVRVRECEPAGLLRQVIYVDLVRVDQQEARRKLLDATKRVQISPARPVPFPGSSVSVRTRPSPYSGGGTVTEVSVARLPITGSHLFGRDRELRELDRVWEASKIHVFSLVAWGGVGKSALVNHWLGRLAEENYRGAAKVFGWSFYSQGTDEREASADLFVSKALEWFGDQDTTAGSAWDKGERLARLVRKQRTLLVLDGLEPLQHPPGPLASRLKDQAMAALLRDLASQNMGLCVITSRLPVADLSNFEDQTVLQRELEHLSSEAGAQILRSQGVRGTREELERAAGDFGGHSLALSLLGSYLRDAFGGDVWRRGEIGPLEAEDRHGGHARRVLESYERWFGEGPERAVLRLLGLFNRPADSDAMAALRNAPVISGLTEPLQDLPQPKWNMTLSRLRNAGLLVRADLKKSGTLDAHPLIREHFGQKLKTENPAAWHEAHGRLYQHYKETSEEFPKTLEGMIPLYAAVTHGCEAGQHQQALREVWRERITKAEGSFATQKHGADLGALASFFSVAWSKPVGGLDPEDRGYVLHQAGFRLRAVGRLAEAVEPMKKALEVELKREDLRRAAINANHISEFYLPLGDLPQAVKFARQGLELAERIGSNFMRMVTRTTLADALHQAGDLVEAKALFQESEEIQRRREPQYPLVYSVWGFRYCDVLLNRRDWRTVQERVEQTIKIVRGKNWHADIGLDYLSLGRAFLLAAQAGIGEFSRAEENLVQAINYLRQTGTQDHLPRALLARAELSFLTDRLSCARADLDEALSIATRGGMRLFEADCHLGFARLHLHIDRAKARSSLDCAWKMIKEMGYHRRDKELADLEQALT